jgi:hypothetical protein
LVALNPNQPLQQYVEMGIVMGLMERSKRALRIVWRQLNRVDFMQKALFILFFSLYYTQGE